MKIKIESDVFNIIKRIKEIDENYFIVYNTCSKKFELHNSDNINTYCITIPYKNLDARTIELIHRTSVKNFDKIINDIDKNNEKIEHKQVEKLKEISEYKIREILKYSDSGNRSVDQAFKTTWV